MSEKSKSSFGLLIAGFGGQGVLTIGEILAHAGLDAGKNVSWLPTYDTFRRGGRVACYVVLSDDEILSPLISEPEVMIIADLPALKIYQDSLVPGGALIIDSSLIDPGEVTRTDINLVAIPASELAKEIETNRVFNLVLLGLYVALTGVLPIDDMEKALGKSLQQSGKDGFFPMNNKALRCGYDWMREREAHPAGD
jgi:2-oxoglutarate ferredoxin oxidoreductase subunit gamma